MRPYAIVLSDDIYQFDSEEFHALARDVGAQVIHTNTSDLSTEELEKILLPALKNAYRIRFG